MDGAINPRIPVRVARAAAVLWLLAAVVRADVDDAGLPRNVCHQSCGERQAQIWARFEAGGGLDFALLPRVYAGVCHLLGDNLSPESEHHVGFMIAAHGGEHKLRLRFSFFTAAQPYAELTPAQAGDRLGAPLLPLAVHDDYAYAEVSGRRFAARYWLRRARDRTLLVSYFGDRVIILCDAGVNG